MRIPLILLALLVLLLLLLFRSISSQDDLAPGFTADASRSGSVQDRDATSSGTEEVRVSAPRPISPERFAQPFAQNAVQLERIAPRQPLTPPKPKAPKRTLLYRPDVSAPGLITYERGQVQLAGITVLDPLETCTDETGDNWPCGIIARTAFRNFLRGRALSCIVPEGSWDEPVVSQCFVGTQDPAAWLVSQGWARTVSGSGYLKMEQSARQNQKGVFGSDPRKTRGTQY
ncbi:MAG: thermonuclease family protein [Alphaproteobacteria bacterium]|nr:thermonuclease family protein [Alphaproteobacteria bacterium]